MCNYFWGKRGETSLSQRSKGFKIQNLERKFAFGQEQTKYLRAYDRAANKNGDKAAGLVIVFLRGVYYSLFSMFIKQNCLHVLLTLILFFLADQLLLWSAISVLVIKTLVARKP